MNRRTFLKAGGIAIAGLILPLGLLAKEDKGKPKEKIDNKFVAIGYIVPFASWKELPERWHECDGSELSKKKYASLFAAIGTTYGSSVNNFNLPDMRGRFVGDGYGNATTKHSEYLNIRYLIKVS